MIAAGNYDKAQNYGVNSGKVRVYKMMLSMTKATK